MCQLKHILGLADQRAPASLLLSVFGFVVRAKPNHSYLSSLKATLVQACGTRWLIFLFHLNSY